MEEEGTAVPPLRLWGDSGSEAMVQKRKDEETYHLPCPLEAYFEVGDTVDTLAAHSFLKVSAHPLLVGLVLFSAPNA